MARLVVNTQNTLFADTLRRTLGKDGDFTVYTVDRPGNVLTEINRVAAEIVLLEVTAYTPWKLSERLALRGSIRKADPHCKIVFLVDEKIDAKIAEEVKEAPKELGKPQVQEAELSMAKTLINAMVQPFQPEQYHDEYKAKLWEIINKKIQGKEITPPAENIQVNVIDIMEALKQSLARVKSNG